MSGLFGKTNPLLGGGGANNKQCGESENPGRGGLGGAVKGVWSQIVSF